jgi:hypothetical protein
MLGQNSPQAGVFCKQKNIFFLNQCHQLTAYLAIEQPQLKHQFFPGMSDVQFFVHKYFEKMKFV